MQLFRCCTGSTPHISGAIEFRKSSKLRDDGGRLLDRYIIVEPFSDLGLIGPCSLPARGVGSLSISTTQRAVYRPPLAPHSLFSIMFHLYMYIYIHTLGGAGSCWLAQNQLFLHGRLRTSTTRVLRQIQFALFVRRRSIPKRSDKHVRTCGPSSCSSSALIFLCFRRIFWECPKN